MVVQKYLSMGKAKSRIRELVDDIGDEMAERLAKTFANMPLRGGA